MILDKKGYDLIQEFEGLRLKAYRDSVGIWTIGVGNIVYEDGSKVKQGDTITAERARTLFEGTACQFSFKVNKMVKKPVTQNQFNALVSLAYNIGLGAFEKSTLLRLVNNNPNDANIAKEFLKWKNAGGKVIQGLLNRRIKESAVYFSK